MPIGLAIALAVTPVAISDAELRAYALSPFDPYASFSSRITLGLHHGVPVVVDFPCSDRCPVYKKRIIHYAVDPGKACRRVGGATMTRAVPSGIWTVHRPFCVPRVISDVPMAS